MQFLKYLGDFSDPCGAFRGKIPYIDPLEVLFAEIYGRDVDKVTIAIEIARSRPVYLSGLRRSLKA